MSSNKSELPKIKIDWRCYSQEVIERGMCSANHILAALDSIQMTHRMHGQPVFFLSAQQVISCDKHSTKRCNGGLPIDVFDYVLENGVIQSSLYHYDDMAKFDGLVSKCRKDIIDMTPPKYRVFIK